MFYSIKGTLTHMEPGFVVVECAGVGFKCLTTLSTQRTMPQIGEQVKLFTHLNVREDAMDLFGFATMMELNCFKMLTAVSGVGPKVGLAILSELSPEQVAMGFAPAGGVPSAAGNAANAVSALSVLGYTPTDAASVVAKFDSSLPTEELIRLALKEFGKNR